MRRELYLECYTGISCRKLLGALLALGAEKEELEQRLTCLAQCLVSIEAQYESQGIEEVVLKNIESACPVFKTKEETEKKIAESPWGEKTKTALYRLWEISSISGQSLYRKNRCGKCHYTRKFIPKRRTSRRSAYRIRAGENGNPKAKRQERNCRETGLCPSAGNQCG